MLSYKIQQLQLTIILICSIGHAGCFSLPQVETPIHQGSQGQIILSTFPQSDTIASHPTSVEPTLLRAALQGLRVREDKGLLASLVSGESQMQAVFTEQELTFLLPHLTKALSQATPEEYVSFFVRNDAAEHSVMTKGSLYRMHHLLRLGLHTFHVNGRQRQLSSKASFSPTRITHWTLGVFPEAARIQEEGNLTTYPILSNIGSVTLDLNVLHNITQTHRATLEQGGLPNSEVREATPKEKHIEGLERDIEGLQQELEKQHQKLKQLEHRLE